MTGPHLSILDIHIFIKLKSRHYIQFAVKEVLQNCKNTNAEYATTSTILSWESPGPTLRQAQPLRTYPTHGDVLNVGCLPSSSHPSNEVRTLSRYSVKSVDIFRTLNPETKDPEERI
jgi:hypothetical protein